MSTLRRYQCDATRVITNARMIYSSSQKHTLVVEGEADLRLLQNWLNEKHARVETVNGKDNVKEVWRKAKAMKFGALHCLADLDYDLVADATPIIDPQFVYVSMEGGESPHQIECNDLESALIMSGAFRKVIAQKCHRKEWAQCGFEEYVNAMRDKLRIASLHIGAFRAADMCFMRSRGSSPIGGDLRITENFFDCQEISLDFEQLAESLLKSSRTSHSAMAEVVEMARSLLSRFSSGWQLCRGHDLTEMLAMHLTSRLNRVVSSREIEQGLRMACELEILRKTRFGKRIEAIGIDIGKPLLTI